MYDAWEAAGAHGWGFDGLLPYFRRSEHAGGDRDRTLRGTGGPVRVAPVAETHRHPAARAFAEALGAPGLPRTGDLSGRRQEGVAWPDLAIDDGQPGQPSQRLPAPGPGPGEPDRPHRLPSHPPDPPRRPVHRRQLRPRRQAGNGARGRRGDRVRRGGRHAAAAACCPASAPPGSCGTCGIEVDGQPARGRGEPPRPPGRHVPATPAPARCPRAPTTTGRPTPPCAARWPGDWPDLHLFPILLPVAPPGHEDPGIRFALVAGVTDPRSRGTVRLASADPEAAPLIDPGFLAEAADLDRLVTGLDIIRRAAAGTAFARLGTSEIRPGPRARDSRELRDWVRSTVGSYYHPAGTCRIGPPPTPAPSPTPSCGSTGSPGCAWRTRPSCRPSPTPTRTRPSWRSRRRQPR